MNSSNIVDFQMAIASVNGSGTLTANRIIHKSLFRHGLNVIGKNLFPSNIEGLPTYYFLRVSHNAQSLKSSSELYIALNPVTYGRDLKTLINTESELLLNTDLKLQSPSDNVFFETSLKGSVSQTDAPIKIKKRMSNLSYVGWVGNYLGLDQKILEDVIADQFNSNKITDANIKVMHEGWNEFEALLNSKPDLQKSLTTRKLSYLIEEAKKIKRPSRILIEGNQAAALGWVDGGCQVATWYPITPSTSLVESFESYAKTLRPKETSVAVLQSEDEISAIASVVGAGWAGARSATATSGPGLSLMSEALGLAYFAEIPAVICDVQRVGPSTGLPTRTSQGDLEFAHKISHGDTLHPVLLPSDPKECYEMSALAFSIADKYQTPIFILSDLDLGMNLWATDEFSQFNTNFDRKQILSESDLENLESKGKEFKRYLGDEHGIPSRTLPGTHHNKAAYFTRGSGHNESSKYSEHPEDYENLMNRLKQKVLSSRMDLPKPFIQDHSNKIGIIYYGTTSQIFPELNELILNELGENVDLCQIKSLPLHMEVLEFIKTHEHIYVVEQNRDAQMKNIILQHIDILNNKTSGNQKTSQQNNFIPCQKISSITNFSGWSIQADEILNKLKSTNTQGLT